MAQNQSEPDYKNWVPKGMVIGFICATIVVALLLLYFLQTDILQGRLSTFVNIALGLILIVLAITSCFFVHLYRTFSYNGKRQFAREIIDHVSDYVHIPQGGTGLDVGCGSAALTIACAKKNPGASMVGLDRWGKEYASFSMDLCKSNAEIEGVASQTSFVQGDALKLDFPDETFDAITSNYCYHNIPSSNRQNIILESLRVLKKGGSFAIHDEFTKGKYGDINQLVDKLKSMGYERVEFVDTSEGLFMDPKEASLLALKGSGLLFGTK